MENTNIVPMKYHNFLTVAEANELIRSKQDDLTILEAKLIRLAISQIVVSDSDINTYSCNIADLARYLQMDRDNIYREVQNLAVSLMKKNIFIKAPAGDKAKGKDNYKIFHWIDYAEYKDGVITFKLSESLKPYLIGLNELFTLYGYTAVLELPTSNAIKLYELLCSYINMPLPRYAYLTEDEIMGISVSIGEYVFSIDYLRDFFNCKDKYKNTGDFIRRIIDNSLLSIHNIKKQDNVKFFSYRLVYSGRKITHIVFKHHLFTSKEYQKFIAELKK